LFSGCKAEKLKATKHLVEDWICEILPAGVKSWNWWESRGILNFFMVYGFFQPVLNPYIKSSLDLIALDVAVCL